MITNLGELSLNEALSVGKVPGAEYWAKFAKGTVGTAWTTIFSGSTKGKLYKYLDEPSNVWVASTDNDDAIGGSGCQTVQIEGLDADFNQQTEVIALGGQAPKSSVRSDWSRITRIFNTDLVGHDVQGQIYVGDSAFGWSGGEPTNVICHIDEDYNQSQIGIYTVPKGYRLKVSNIWLNSMKDKEVECIIVSRNGAKATLAENSVFTERTNVGLYRNVISMELAGAPLLFDELSEFEVRGRVSTSGDEQIYVVANGYLIPNKYFS